MLNKNGRIALGVAGLIEVILLIWQWGAVFTNLYTIALIGLVIWLNEKQRKQHDDSEK
ncbi:hypothetical protein RA086_06710 [Lactiplantibacillus sp. WILCCON 0030]|uniref:Uncharacterized protein n=1 Tax=Lactiplantibacillus brownii TaxID=3069269 RepID=A0ABU1A8S4_9LACO|nr:hypothetical protein [Lactiplantibacillus brownii]MDQ7937317.1 hypothetical protein [Lactiplantibacillus brownii]